MRLKAEQLGQSIQQGLKPVYLIYGDETLLVEEAADQIRQAARAAGANEREVWHVEGRFDWSQVQWQAQALSLFSSQRLIEVRLPSGSPGKEGGERFRAFVADPPEDTTLLIISGKIEQRSLSSKWFTDIDGLGVTLPIWPVSLEQLPGWINQRLRQKGLQADSTVIQMMAQRIEGNLFAAAQEIDKLALLSDGTPLTIELMNEAVADNARFEAFGLMDCVLLGQTEKIPRIISRLRAEGTDVLALFSAVSWSLKRVISMAIELDRGESMERIFNTQKPKVWDKQKPVIRAALERHSAVRWQKFLSRLSDVDKAAKGQLAMCPWHLLEQLCLDAGGMPAALVYE
jgi:DNA polymerase-3 subunit delta